jgi:hypothetical protein
VHPPPAVLRVLALVARHARHEIVLRLQLRVDKLSLPPELDTLLVARLAEFDVVIRLDDIARFCSTRVVLPHLRCEVANRRLFPDPAAPFLRLLRVWLGVVHRVFAGCHLSPVLVLRHLQLDCRFRSTSE